MSFGYMISRMLIQSSLTILLATVLGWIGITISRLDVVSTALLIVTALFVARIMALTVITVGKIDSRWISSFLTYVIVVIVATLMLVILAGYAFNINVWYWIAGMIIFSDVLAWAVLRSAGAGRRQE